MIRIAHWLLIPVFAIGVVVLGGITGTLSRKIKTVQRSIVRETTRLSGTITESLRNIELVKSLGLTWPEIRRLQGYTFPATCLITSRVGRCYRLGCGGPEEPRVSAWAPFC